MQRTVEDHRGGFVKGEVELEMRAALTEVWVNGDRTRLSRVIGNLLQNAVKFTSRGGKTTVSVEADFARKQAIASVQDTGRGIGPELLPRVFEAFYTTKPDGMGMGLAICRSIIAAHGGRMWATANEPRGAVAVRE